MARSRSIAWRYGRRTIFLCCLVALLLPTATLPTTAQETTVSAPVNVNVTETETIPTPTELPILDTPTEIPPTDVPLPTNPSPTEISPTNVPPTIEDEPTATDPPAPTATEPTAPTPTEEPSLTPTATTTMTPTATATSTSTPIANPSVSVQLESTITCTAISTSAILVGDPTVSTCEMATSIDGTDAANVAISLTWTVQGSTGEGWQVNLREPGQAWSGSQLTATANILAGDDPTFAQAVTFTFEAQMIPMGCVATSSSATLNGRLGLALPDHADATINAPSTAASGTITLPTVEGIEPDLAFGGPLNFAEVTPSSFDTTAQTSGTITLLVSNLSVACGDWELTLVGSALDAANGEHIPAGNLQLTAINDSAVAGGSCALDGGCLISIITAGATQPDSQAYVLHVSLTVPAQTMAGSFSSSISASIEAAP